MSPNPKRKVQAQRKFAQGAFIPPTSNAVTAKTDPPVPVKEERRSIIHNNLSAKSLLDIVAFQSMHVHFSPVVVLERLNPTTENSAPATRQEPPEQPTQPKPNLKIEPQVTPPIAPKITSKKTKKIVIKRKAPKKALIQKIAKSKLKLRRLKVKNTMRLRSRKNASRKRSKSATDTEDDTPLTYFKRMRVEPVAPTPPAPSPAPAPVPVSVPVSVPARASPESRVTRTRTRKTKKILNGQRAGKVGDTGRRVTRSSSDSSNIQRNKKIVKFKKNASLSSLNKKKHMANGTATKKNSVIEQLAAKVMRDIEIKTSGSVSEAFKEPAIPARFSKSHHVPDRSIAVASTSKNYPLPVTNGTASSQKKPANPDGNRVGAETRQYYGNSEIKRWLHTNKAGGNNDAEKAKAATEPAEDVTEQFSRDPSVARTVSPCPSESLVTFSDVVAAPHSLMARRCMSCQPCRRVSAAQQINTLMHRSRGSKAKPNDNVYDFDPNEDTSNPPPFFLNRKRNTRPQNADKSKDTAATSVDDEPVSYLYLDLQKESPHIIEMTCVKVPNTTKKMMKARLIPKSEAHSAEEFSLVEHEILLDELLQVLKVNDNKDEETEAEQDSEDNSQPPERTEMSTRSERLSRSESTERHCKMDNRAGRDKPGKERASTKTAEKSAKLVEAPVYHPTEAEFNDPISFFEKIAPLAAKYGLCKVVAPESFKPTCILNDALKFNVTNHYIARLFSRWGSAAREISAMRAYLATQNINFNRVPLLDSLEVNLPKLYSVVQRNGGLEQVLEKKRWGRVAEEMRFSKGPNTEKTLDTYYVKYLLPYDTASNEERTTIMGAVEKCWNRKHRKLVEWASNPLHQQKKLLGESDSSDEEPSDDSIAVKALHEAEDCVVAGRPMHLNGFKKVAAHAMTMYMGKQDATAEEIEKEYWRIVLLGTEHVCVNAASIDTAASGYGFSKNRNHPEWKHPWNLKNLSSNTNNVLRSLNAVLGVTVPTLHLGMVFSTCCWHRDPHGLPWMEYMHEGPPKIWYGIPDEQSDNFRRAVEVLCPTSCQNKYIWLSSDITMIPPNLLREHKVSLSHTVQKPGEFIIVFPKSYSCSISTGFTVSESVYFATNSWLKTVHQVFQELRSSCEPTTFSLEQLLFALAKDPRSSFGVLHTVHSSLTTIVDEETRHRNTLKSRGATVRVRSQAKKRNGAAWNVREQDECQICRSTLYLSKVTGVLSKKSDLCLMHAIRVLETRNCSKEEVANMELIVFYTEQQLSEIMEHLQKRLFSE